MSGNVHVWSNARSSQTQPNYKHKKPRPFFWRFLSLPPILSLSLSLSHTCPPLAALTSTLRVCLYLLASFHIKKIAPECMRACWWEFECACTGEKERERERESASKCARSKHTRQCPCAIKRTIILNTSKLQIRKPLFFLIYPKSTFGKKKTLVTAYRLPHWEASKGRAS